MSAKNGASSSQNNQGRQRQPRRRRRNKPVKYEDMSRNQKCSVAGPSTAPANLSREQTSRYTDDPLWDECIDDNECGLHYCGPVQDFYVDAAGYLTLVEEEYRAIASVDKDFAKDVSLSVFNYFAMMCLWYRGAQIAQHHGKSTPAEDELVSYMQSREIRVPVGIAAYLEGLGDFTDELGVPHQCKMQVPNDSGHFGRIDENTHGLYETLPAPAIAMQRVLEDLRYTLTKEGQDWDLPEIRPVEPDESSGSEDEGTRPREQMPPNRPTVNLLGWQKVCELTPDQVSSLMDALKMA